MTNWQRIRDLAGPNEEHFPGGENVYLFSGSAPDAAWLQAFSKEAEANGLKVAPKGMYLFVVVPS